ncbi:hypothetical protein BOW51_08800 [Solemya velesiana gill symbiont]|uniref:Uncharacterized protein n=1 Tax=Solemya velesiana gill symbiont TaxID=1918948 RepID=A0A1T2KTR4_9GAMM|nr:hypothetical protein BOW51_08800 [Solemya velesiana gill symbiont]
MKHSVPGARSNACCVSGVKSGGGGVASSQGGAVAGDCKTLRERYFKRCSDLGAHYSKLNCERHGYSGCALDSRSCFSVTVNNLFNDADCGSPGYRSCASEVMEAYLRCLKGCNEGAINRTLGESIDSSATRCRSSAESGGKTCQSRY